MFSVSHSIREHFPDLANELVRGMIPIRSKTLLYSTFCIIGILCMITENFLLLLLLLYVSHKMLGIVKSMITVMLTIVLTLSFILISIYVILKLFSYDLMNSEIVNYLINELFMDTEMNGFSNFTNSS